MGHGGAIRSTLGAFRTGGVPRQVIPTLRARNHGWILAPPQPLARDRARPHERRKRPPGNVATPHSAPIVVPEQPPYPMWPLFRPRHNVPVRFEPAVFRDGNHVHHLQSTRTNNHAATVSCMDVHAVPPIPHPHRRGNHRAHQQVRPDSLQSTTCHLASCLPSPSAAAKCLRTHTTKAGSTRPWRTNLSSLPRPVIRCGRPT